MAKEKDNPARASTSAPTRLMRRRREPLALAVAHRRQTHEAQRQYTAALDVFLAEWVRQHLGPQKRSS